MGAAKLKFEFQDDLSCKVTSAEGETWQWPREQVTQALHVAQVCQRSRQAGPCDCVCCQLEQAFRDMRASGPLYILWDPRDGSLALQDDGTIISDGLIGRIGPDNIYLTAYAKYPTGKSYRDLDVGEGIAGVVFSLSGSRGVYTVYRVR